MATGKILNRDEEARLVALIGKAERKTTGEIRIHIANKTTRHGIMTDAYKTFDKLGMRKTRHRNGVLLYITLKDRGIACIGDQAIHEKIGDDGWKKIVADLIASFSKKDFYLGLHNAIIHIGETLERHFPDDGTEGSGENELPDDISHS